VVGFSGFTSKQGTFFIGGRKSVVGGPCGVVRGAWNGNAAWYRIRPDTTAWDRIEFFKLFFEK
jgi:hypothetical protein